MLQFIDSARIIASSLSSFVDNLAESICKVKCKYGHDVYLIKPVELNTIILSAVLNTQYDLMLQKC